MTRLTDRNAVKIALLLAIDSEDAMIDAYRKFDGTIDESVEGVQIARRHIAAFERVLDRYYDGARKPKLPRGEPINIFQLLNMPARDFDPNADT